MTNRTQMFGIKHSMHAVPDCKWDMSGFTCDSSHFIVCYCLRVHHYCPGCSWLLVCTRTRQFARVLFPISLSKTLQHICCIRITLYICCKVYTHGFCCFLLICEPSFTGNAAANLWCLQNAALHMQWWDILLWQAASQHVIAPCTTCLCVLKHVSVLAANHMVTMADLKKASKLIREQKKHRHASQHGTQKQSQAEVVDVD